MLTRWTFWPYVCAPTDVHFYHGECKKKGRQHTKDYGWFQSFPDEILVNAEVNMSMDAPYTSEYISEYTSESTSDNFRNTSVNTLVYSFVRCGSFQPPPFVGSYSAVVTVGAAALFTHVFMSVFHGVVSGVFTGAFTAVCIMCLAYCGPHCLA